MRLCVGVSRVHSTRLRQIHTLNKIVENDEKKDELYYQIERHERKTIETIKQSDSHKNTKEDFRIEK